MKVTQINRRSMERASHRHPTTKEIRGGIISLYESGEDRAYIAQAFGVSKKTVDRWIKRHEMEGTTETRHRPGRPRITSEMQDQVITATMEAEPTRSAHAVRDELQLQCSIRTVARRLRASGLFARTPAIKPLLTPRCKEIRLAFAREYADMAMNDWKKVIFCDEKVFSSESLAPQSVWRRVNTR